MTFSETGQTTNRKDCWNTIGVYGALENRCVQLKQYLHCRYCPIFTKAAQQLLHRPLPVDYQKELTTVVAQPRPTKPVKLSAIFGFKAGPEWLAIASRHIDEIVDMAPVHSLPRRSNSIFRGLVNIRGRLELCFAVGGVLGLERHRDLQKTGYISPERLVIIIYETARFVFPVTEVMGTIHYDATLLNKLPVTASRAQTAYTRGIISHRGKDIGLLDMQALTTAFTNSLL